MSKYFSIRHALKITISDQSHTFYIRELSFSRFKEINDSTVANDENERGLLLLKRLVIESVEEENGSKSYDEASWNDELKTVVDQIAKAVFKAQGVELGAEKEAPLTPEQAEGNAEPSKRSGASSQSSSAAPSENSKAA